MDELTFRVLFILRFLAFMAIVYLALHMVVAPWLRKPGSKVAAFFSTLTSPLTRPVRAFLGSEMPETRVRLITLAVLVVLWLAFAVLTARVGARFR